MAPDGDALYEEVVRLRDWRHNVASPEIAAALAQAKQLSADLLVVERRLEDVEHSLSRMARADEIAAAVTARLAENTEQSKKIRRSRLNAWEQIVVGTAAVAGTVSVALQIAHG